jgi:hypothetical protein
LLVWAIRAIHVVTAVITAKEKREMNTLITEETGTAQATGAEKQKPSKKARVAAKRAHVALKKAKSASKAKAPKRAPKAAKEAGAVRDGTKAAKVMDLLKRPDGATMKELMKVTGCAAKRRSAYKRQSRARSTTSAPSAGIRWQKS